MLAKAESEWYEIGATTVLSDNPIYDSCSVWVSWIYGTIGILGISHLFMFTIVCFDPYNDRKHQKAKPSAIFTHVLIIQDIYPSLYRFHQVDWIIKKGLKIYVSRSSFSEHEKG